MGRQARYTDFVPRWMDDPRLSDFGDFPDVGFRDQEEGVVPPWSSSEVEQFLEWVKSLDNSDRKMVLGRIRDTFCRECGGTLPRPCECDEE